MNNLNIKLKSSIVNSPVTSCPSDRQEERWALILAGGDGSRLLPLTRKITGDERPKQFCRILGSDTLLEKTRRRVELGLSPMKTMYVLTRKHEGYYNEILADVMPRHLIVQPKNIGTAPAILYSLLHLEQRNPAASVAFFPSDHYFSDDRAFMAHVASAFDGVRSQPDLITLLGIEPENPDEEYGWIEPDAAVLTGESQNVWRVRRFWEKPSPVLARELMARGCLWNSFVMVGKVSTFLRMIRRAAPELFMSFSDVKSKLGMPEEEEAIQNLYAHLPETNFSQNVLTARAKDLAVIPVIGSKWSDLGSPHRVLSTLSKIGRTALMQREQTGLSVNLSEEFYERARICGSEAVRT